MWTLWRTKLDKTTGMPGENSRMQNDNWEYGITQKINNTKQKKGFYNATLLINNVPVKFIIDSGSSVTLIPECRLNNITTIEQLKTTYKDVNNQKIDSAEKTKAVFETNKETI